MSLMKIYPIKVHVPTMGIVRAFSKSSFALAIHHACMEGLHAYLEDRL